MQYSPKSIINERNQDKLIIESLLKLPFFTSISKRIKEDDLSQLAPLFQIFNAKKSSNRYSLKEHNYYFIISGSAIIQDELVTGLAGPINLFNILPQEMLMTLTTSDCLLASLETKKLDQVTNAILTANIKSLIQDIKQFSLFRHLYWKVYENLFHCLNKRQFEKEDIVLKEGQFPSEVFFIKKGQFRLMKKNRKRILDNDNELLDLVEKELICSKKEDQLLSKCIKDNINPRSSKVADLRNDIAKLKAEISFKKDEPSEGYMTLIILEEPNMFGDIEFATQANELQYSVVCLSQTAEVFYLTYDDLVKTMNHNMRERMRNEAKAKCVLLRNKYNSDINVNIKNTKSKENISQGQSIQYCSRHDFTLNKNNNKNKHNLKYKFKTKTQHYRDKLMPLILTKSCSMNFILNKSKKNSTEKIEPDKNVNKSNAIQDYNTDCNNDNYDFNDASNRIQLRKMAKCISDSNIGINSMRLPSNKISLPHFRNDSNRYYLSNWDKSGKTNFPSTNYFSETVRNNQDIMRNQKNQYIRTRIKLPLKKEELKNKVAFNFFQSSMKSLLLEVNPLSVEFVNLE